MSTAEVACRVLMIEDDRRIADLTARYLGAQRIDVRVVTNGLEGEREALRSVYDCIVLDLMLPGCDGTEVCRRLRTRLDVPIIMVTARTEEADRVLGLELGADDYLTKPFSARELLARIRALVRRARGHVGPQRHIIDLGRLVLDKSRLSARFDDRVVELTPYEFAVVWALAERPGRLLTRDQLLELTQGSTDQSFDRSIDVHISRVRAKLGDDARRPTLLKTVRRVGYVLALGDPAP